MSKPYSFSPNTFGPNTVVRRAKEIVFQQFDDELLAVDAEANICFSLNESAGRIWALIESPQTVAVLCAQLATEYEVDDETCRREVSNLLQGLERGRIGQDR